MKELFALFRAFFRVGALTFGGGYAMLPILQREVGDKRGWATDEEMMDYYAIAQCLPGIIAVNTSILLGNKIKKKAGGIAAALGVVTPSILIILVIAAFLQNFLDYEIVQRAFWGIRIVVSALIVQAIVKLWKASMKGAFSYLLYLFALIVAWFTPVPTAVMVIAAVLIGVGHGILGERRSAGA